jgi:hypothetical protein
VAGQQIEENGEQDVAEAGSDVFGDMTCRTASFVQAGIVASVCFALARHHGHNMLRLCHMADTTISGYLDILRKLSTALYD